MFALLFSCKNQDPNDEEFVEGAKRTPDAAEYLAAAKKQADALVNDPDQAGAWRDGVLKVLERCYKSTEAKNEKLDNDHYTAAKNAMDSAYALVIASKDVEKNIVCIIKHGLDFSLACRQASDDYKYGTTLNSLKKNKKRIVKEFDSVSECNFDQLEECLSILSSTIDTMRGEHQERESTAPKRDDLLGPASIKIAEESFQVREEIGKVQPGNTYILQVNTEELAGRKQCANSLVRIVVLLAESLKAHYEHKEFQGVRLSKNVRD
jgi:hypothetical protein